MNQYNISEYLDEMERKLKEEEDNKKSLPKQQQKMQVSLKNIPASFSKRNK